MLKHASICRTKRAQEALVGQWDPSDHTSSEPLKLAINGDGFLVRKTQSGDCGANQFTQNVCSNPTSGIWPPSPQAALFRTASCSSSPTPSLQSTTISRIGSLSSAPSSVFNSPRKSKTPALTTTKCCSTSTIKVYAQTLGQEVEYLTIPVDAQTQSRHIIRALLKKFRLKHRDPNLFYLTLERWIRKDGLRQKSVMLLADEACPLQLQQCCSNPPHNDIKFTLQMKAGALVKIFCQDVCPNTRYKCISLSTQTTVAETIELMLHCLDLVDHPDVKKDDNFHRSSSSAAVMAGSMRRTNTPDSTSSSSSSTTSSSGIESDPTSNPNNYSVPPLSLNNANCHQLGTSSMTGSVVSITSASDMPNGSNVKVLCELYCLIIECADTDYKRVLESDEYLVDVYQNLLDEMQEQPSAQPIIDATNAASSSRSSTSNVPPHLSIKQSSDRRFVIKLKKRDDLNHHRCSKFTNPRQNIPLPPIPHSLAPINNANHLQNFVSTAQIEVTSHQPHRPSSSLAIISIAAHKSAIDGVNGPNCRAGSNMATIDTKEPINCHQRHMSAVVSGTPYNTGNYPQQTPPSPTERPIWMPQVKPRRRNLTNASTTFGTQQTGAPTGTVCNRRRYDPAQLAEDLNQLNLASTNLAEGKSENSALKMSGSTSLRP